MTAAAVDGAGSAARRGPQGAGSRPAGTRDLSGATQVAAVFGNVVIGVGGATGAALVLALSLIRLGAAPATVSLSWAGYIAACALAHVALWFAYRREANAGARWRVWGRRFTALGFAEGIGWGWGAICLVGGDRLEPRLLAYVVCFGVAAGTVPAFGAYRPAFLAMFLPTTVPELVWSLATLPAQPQQAVFLMLTLVFIVTLGGLGLRFNHNFRQIVGLQLRADALADELRRQKEVAEQANLAKSMFLAAASHDLRQPVHALSLFIGALRTTPMPPASLRLVDQIEASTQALDGLFGALLDISRLDAGIVEPQRGAFAIDDLVARICGEHAGEAAAKGLALRRVLCSREVETDPVLMERILRNLIVNAIRHTRRGRVLVGCRRRGDRLRVEVWDTGQGIAPDQRDRIFLEYVQIDNPERDRVKGLGLGLAIVRRLSLLLECPVDLRSTPGRGSCFGVSIPLATGRGAARALSDIAPATGHEGGLILVIDDESAIQEGMARLLGGWGYAVIVAGSCAEMLERLADCPDVPRLIICDYRLRAGETGSQAIERLQSEYNEPIPAILVTGDTAPDRLVEAQASGFLLLHKPVPNGKLRAAIGHLLAATPAEDASRPAGAVPLR